MTKATKLNKLEECFLALFFTKKYTPIWYGEVIANE